MTERKREKRTRAALEISPLYVIITRFFSSYILSPSHSLSHRFAMKKIDDWKWTTTNLRCRTVQRTISSIIPIKNERQVHTTILTSHHQSRIKNVHHCPSFSYVFILINAQRAEEKKRTRQSSSKFRWCN